MPVCQSEMAIAASIMYQPFVQVTHLSQRSLKVADMLKSVVVQCICAKGAESYLAGRASVISTSRREHAGVEQDLVRASLEQP
jgi:hypothetical protein